jgi:dTDP-L-rhamnose 4-epimerase
MNKVLITGGAGFIGSHIADLFLKKGYQVKVLDNLSSRTHFDKWPEYLDPKIEKIKGDVRSKKDLTEALTGVDFVIHLAAFMDLVPQFSQFVETNIKSTAMIYELIIKNNLKVKKIIIASSQFVYGEGRWNCLKHGEVFPKNRNLQELENSKWDPVCPIGNEKIKPLPNLESYQDPPNTYAISKYTQELIGIKLGRLYQIPTVALRYSIVHGSRQSFKNMYSGALRIFTLQMSNGKQPTIYEDGGQLRDYVSVHDVAMANLKVLEDKRADFQIFNVGGGKAYSVLELANMIAKRLNVKINPKITREFRLGDIRHAISDITKLKQLSWEPKISEEETILEYINWVKTQKIVKDYAKKSEKNLRQMGSLRKVKK